MKAATLRQTATAEAIEKRAIHMEAFLHRFPRFHRLTGAKCPGLSMQAADNTNHEYPFRMEPAVPCIFLWARRMRSKA
jgi:hypothetical protein